MRTVLRPIAKAMIAHGVPLSTGLSILKEVLVDVASQDTADGKPPSDSRITAITGVHRKDVKAIRERDEQTPPEAKPSVIGNVVGRWLGSSQYQTPDGLPAPLPRTRQPDGAPSFADIVREVSTDIRPASVLEAMSAQRLIEIREASDEVVLRTQAYIPTGDRSDLYDFWGKNLRDHVLAATHNVTAEGGAPVFFERAVFYHQLTDKSVAQLDADARAAGMAVLQNLNKSASTLQEHDRSAADAKHRFRFGMFFYTEPETDVSKSEDENDTAKDRASGND